MIEQFFPVDHPAAEGHFPGSPIIPGALLLSETVRAIAANLGTAYSPCQIASAKFFYPVRPGDRVLIDFACVASSIKFNCTVVGRTVLSGRMKIQAVQAGAQTCPTPPAAD